MGWTTWGNMDLSNDTGDAPFPDGNGGEVTEIDLIGWYSRRIGDVDYEFGLINYSFPSGVGGSTNEAYVSASWEAVGIDMGFSVFYDFDELDDYYANFGVGHSFELDNNLSLDAGVSVGAMGEGQAEAYFGTKDSGLADQTAGALNAASVEAVNARLQTLANELQQTFGLEAARNLAPRLRLRRVDVNTGALIAVDLEGQPLAAVNELD